MLPSTRLGARHVAHVLCPRWWDSSAAHRLGLHQKGAA
uniref:Uncharacterized protein n=1 Tax=Arundo donax TaxID=35708 RepID=A0A0A9AFB2_ARUDO